jgi:hypothetical protein
MFVNIEFCPRRVCGAEIENERDRENKAKYDNGRSDFKIRHMYKCNYIYIHMYYLNMC